MTVTDVLLVEDDPDDEALTVLALHKVAPDLRITVVHDGVEAVDFLLCRGEYARRDAFPMPRVILLDMNMPRLDGISTLRELRSHPTTRLLPVVMLTSCGGADAIQRGFAAGANSYICKPVRHSDYLRIVSLIGQYWLNLNEPRIAS